MMTGNGGQAYHVAADQPTIRAVDRLSAAVPLCCCPKTAARIRLDDARKAVRGEIRRQASLPPLPVVLRLCSIARVGCCGQGGAGIERMRDGLPTLRYL